MIRTTGTISGSTLKVAQPMSIQTRQFSRRRIAYPAYQVNLDKKHPKEHASNLRLMMRKFLGPRNRKGEYYKNKYYYPPQNHEPNYIAPDLEKGQSLDTKAKYSEDEQRRSKTPERVLQPFPANKYCQTALAIDRDLKKKLVEEVVERGVSIQETAIKYGIKIPRIEAIIKLQAIEEQWKKENKITPDMQKMSDIMYNMFPLYQPPKNAENLTEIPIPAKTLQSRFLTIAESEPFGPVDAAKVFGLEPAADTLEKLAKFGAEELSAKKKTTQHGFVAPVLEGERTSFTFTKANVGEVGFRYGAGNRDNKKNRKISYDQAGKMIYI